MQEELALESGCVYIIGNEEFDKTYDIFSDIIRKGAPGLCITRHNPERVRVLHELSKTPILWLTENRVSGQTTIGPTEFFKLYPMIDDFVRESEDGLILLDGLEYLILENDFKTVMKFVERTNDAIMASSSRLLLHIDPNIFDPKEYHLLKRWMKFLPEMKNNK